MFEMNRALFTYVLVIAACLFMTTSAGADVKTIDYGFYGPQPVGSQHPRFLNLSYENVQKLSRKGIEIQANVSGRWIIDIQGYAGAKKGKKEGRGSKSGRRVNFKTRRVMPKQWRPFFRIPFKKRMYRRAKRLIKKSGKLPAKIGLTVDLYEPDVRRIFYSKISITLVP